MINKLHVHEWVPIRKGFPQKICKCGELKVGTHTVLLGDKIRFTSTKVASILGDIGMSLATGRPSGFVGGVDAPLALLSEIGGSLSTALFTISNTSGTASTGALGFTPKIVFYVGASSDGTSPSIAIGFATGVGALQRGCGFGYNQGSGSPQDPGGSAAADNASIAGLTQAIQNNAQLLGAFSRLLQVTAFSAAGISFTWNIAVSSHQANVLVIG